MLKMYRVMWEIDVEAENEQGAAIEASRVMLKEHVKWSFDVCDSDCLTPKVKIDLEDCDYSLT